jgi:hypothetical protein
VSGRDIEAARYVLKWSPAAETWTIVDLPDADVSAERAEIIAYPGETGQPRTPSVIATVLRTSGPSSDYAGRWPRTGRSAAAAGGISPA